MIFNISGSIFGRSLEAFSNIFPTKGSSTNWLIFEIVWVVFFFDFGIQVAPRLAHDSGPLGAPRSSCRRWFDLSLLPSFWDRFAWILNGFGTMFGQFWIDIRLLRVRFPSLASLIPFSFQLHFLSSCHPSLLSSTLVSRTSCEECWGAMEIIAWPGGLREAIK